MTDNNHTSTEEQLLSVHEESLLRSALNRRAVPVPDIEKAWQDVAVKSGITQDSNGSTENHHDNAKIFHFFIALAACIVLFFFIIKPFVQDKTKIAVSTRTEQSDSVYGESQVAVRKSDAASDNKQTGAQTVQLSTLNSQTIVVPRATLRRVTLPDGTQVWLNAGSELKYAFTKTDGKRMVSLQGEGYFEVKHDTRRPFIVEAGGVKVTDIGTEFNVSAYSGAKPEIVVVEGKVKAEIAESNAVLLNAGMQATVNGSRFSVITIDTYPYTQWRNGLFYYHDTTLWEAVKNIGRWYGCNIVVENDKVLDTRIHFVAERKQTLREVIYQLNDIDGVDISLDNGEIIIR